MPRFHFTKRPGRSAGYCMVCNCASDQVYVFSLGTFILRLCRDCLGQLRQEIGEVLEGNASPTYTCPGCGRPTAIVLNKANCPACMGSD